MPETTHTGTGRETKPGRTSPTDHKKKQKPVASRRKKGVLTRRKILRATLAVICRDGLRGVTHRSVAAEAGVHLSLTTYYFSDIEEMIRKALQQFCEMGQPDLENSLEMTVRYLDSFPASQLRRIAVREEICDRIATLAARHVFNQIINNADRLAIEQILFNEGRLSPEVRQMAAEHRRQLLEPLTKLCRYFNRRDPEINAELLFGAITSMEYQSLTLPREDVDLERIATLLRRQIGWLAGLKCA